MKLVTYKTDKSEERIGIRFSDSNAPEQDSDPALGLIVDFAKGLSYLGGEMKLEVSDAATRNMVDFIKEQDKTLLLAKSIEMAYQDNALPQDVFMRESKTTLISPVAHPASTRDGYAFRQHVEAARRNRGVEMIPEFDEFPVFYFTNHLATFGPGIMPVKERHLDRLDFELECAIVIGKGGMDIPASKADEHIFGYMVMNDWSARALQMQEMKLNLGPAKGKDFGNSFGPYLVTRDQLKPKRIDGEQGERYDLRMQCWVNDIQVSDGNTKDMTWTFAQIIERASYGVQLHPGEVIGSGTVGTGCFLELNGSKITDNQWLQDGDRIRLQIDELGALDNTVKKF